MRELIRRPYADRRDAGRQLAAELSRRGGLEGALVLALPRGGVPVAHEVAAALGADLDIVVVRKLGLPMQPEVAMGAIASIAGTVEVVRNEDVLSRLGPRAAAAMEEVRAREEAELRRRERAYRGDRAALSLRGRVVVLVDDGLATGATMRAAAAAVQREEPARLVVAVPVALSGSFEGLGGLADEVVSIWSPRELYAVGQAYAIFDQTTDDEVHELLASHRHD